jgi:hypothetical protein
VSVFTDFVTVTLSERVFELLLPRIRATISNNNTAPPTIHTQGWVYHVSVVVVVVVLELEELLAALSCAKAIACINASIKNVTRALYENALVNCFIV